MIPVAEIQNRLAHLHIDGWLLYDFAKNNPLCYEVLKLPENHIYRRRFFYWIPKSGTPIKIMHAIEASHLDHCPGEKQIYASWQTLHAALKKALHSAKIVAMEYSPMNEIPYLSKVDGGTIDLVRSFGVNVVSSAPLLPYFTAILTQKQEKSLFYAGKALEEVVSHIWDWIFTAVKANRKISEYDTQQEILKEFAKRHIITDHPPNVSVNANSANPHYMPSKNSCLPICKNDFVLIDMWGKQEGERTIFADITRVGVIAAKPTAKQQEIFSIVKKAQEEATSFVKKRFALGQEVLGFEIDDRARKVIADAGFGPFFTHRTGHNIGTELHGSYAHIDNLETHDARPILPNTCFSIEPGIYLPGEFGVRLEYDLFIDKAKTVHIIGGAQETIACSSENG